MSDTWGNFPSPYKKSEASGKESGMARKSNGNWEYRTVIEIPDRDSHMTLSKQSYNDTLHIAVGVTASQPAIISHFLRELAAAISGAADKAERNNE